jgi:hypothetical protein
LIIVIVQMAVGIGALALRGQIDGFLTMGWEAALNTTEGAALLTQVQTTVRVSLCSLFVLSVGANRVRVVQLLWSYQSVRSRRTGLPDGRHHRMLACHA